MSTIDQYDAEIAAIMSNTTSQQTNSVQSFKTILLRQLVVSRPSMHSIINSYNKK